jgi:hypothetical protein
MGGFPEVTLFSQSDTSMMVTRDEGYERGRGKEDPALDVVRDCIKSVMGLEAGIIADKERNRLYGDLEFVGTAECKGQPIDPDRYANNFVEVFEDVTDLGKEMHSDGFARTAEILEIPRGEFSEVTYVDHRFADRPVLKLGVICRISTSMESIAGSDLTIYANADPKRTFVYFYTREFLLRVVREAVLRGGLRRGMGQSNEDTFGVLVPVSPARWCRVDGQWHFVGEGRPPIDRIRAALTGHDPPEPSG